jgi:hypothetical protein
VTGRPLGDVLQGMRALLVLTLFVLLGCGSQEATSTQPATRRTPTISEAMCLLAVDYDGHRYVGSSVLAAPAYGQTLGRGTLPACNDTPGAVDDAPDQLVEVIAIKGVGPETAVALRDHSDIVLIRDDVDQAKLPPALAKLMAPR